MIYDTFHDTYVSIYNDLKGGPEVSELMIRPGANDHEVIKDLLAPSAGAVLMPGARSLIDRLVLDAHVAALRPDFVEAADSAGVPVLIDPLTFFLQGELREKDRWAQLPFGDASKLVPTDLSDPFRREALVASVVDFQLEQGATAIIPPYLYVSSPTDPWFDVALNMLRSTSRYMRREGIALPIVPVLCAQLKGFGFERSWPEGIDRFAAAALDLGPEAIAVCFSPAGAVRTDSYHKLLRLFAATRRIRRNGARVIAWRQGVYGPGLVAAGLDGYETGIGTREQANLAGAIGARKPRPGKKNSGGAGLGIYLEPLRRSVPSKVGETLLGDRSMRPKVMCDDERCCLNGAASTLDQRRHHAVRSRSREMTALEGQPHTSWRLHQVGKDARHAADLAVQANAVLEQSGLTERIGISGYEALADVMEFLRASTVEAEAA
jgi:hypothetical protein